MWLGLLNIASAGVWVQELGTGYVQLSWLHQESSRVFLADGDLVEQTDPALLGTLAPLFDDARYATNDVAAYAEVGIGQGIELVVSAPFRSATNRWSLARGSYPDIVHRGVGFGDLLLGGRLGERFGGWAVSGLATVRLPLYDNSADVLRVGAGNSDFEDDRVPLGSGTSDVDLLGGVGRGFGRGWGLVEAGIRLRNRGFSMAVPARIQLGVKPVRRIAVWLGADGQLSLGNGAAPDLFRDRWGKGPVAIDNQSAASASFGASVDLVGGLALVASVGRILHAVRFPRLTSASVGLSWAFDVRRAE